jgi:arginyl-tRNA--protein-N-Asp/Glu arginylyltransferase
MKLLFSEAPPDYGRYLYPYVIWAYPEPGETPADLFEAGFLPSQPDLSRFYLGRQLRLPLSDWRPNSENRRVLRKGAEWACELIPRTEFAYTESRRDAWLAYAAQQFGPGAMPRARLDRLMSNAVISHLLRFTDRTTGEELGTVLLHLQSPRLAYYYFAFYDLARKDRNLGMFMMTRAAAWFAEGGFARLYLGTCYSERALYKTQFDGVEVFNGHRWSTNLAELKHLIRTEAGTHRLDDPAYVALLEGGTLEPAIDRGFRVALPR